MPIDFQNTTRSKLLTASLPCVKLIAVFTPSQPVCHCSITLLCPIVVVSACSKDGRPEIYLKREDLNHTGAHKINNSLGQALLCRRMGKKRVIAETGAGQHGVATVSDCVT